MKQALLRRPPWQCLSVKAFRLFKARPLGPFLFSPLLIVGVSAYKPRLGASYPSSQSDARNMSPSVPKVVEISNNRSGAGSIQVNAPIIGRVVSAKCLHLLLTVRLATRRSFSTRDGADKGSQ